MLLMLINGYICNLTVINANYQSLIGISDCKRLQCALRSYQGQIEGVIVR